MRREHRLRARRAEGELPGEHFVAHDRERVEIGEFDHGASPLACSGAMYDGVPSDLALGS